MKKFYTYESGVAQIDVQALYDALINRGIRYFKTTNDNMTFIVIFIDNTVEVYLHNELWRFCCWLIDKEFKSETEEERTHVKKALEEIKKKLKKGNLSLLKIEELEKCEENESKKFLQKLMTKSADGKGGNEV